MSVSKPKKKKTANYTAASLELALLDIRENQTGLREACRKYGIPKSTLQDRKSGKRPDRIGKKGPEPVLGLTGEQQVVQWIIDIAKCGFPVKKNELLDTVQKIINDLGNPNPFKDNRPGQTWYMNFLKRNPEISLRSAESINKARARVTEESIRLWFRELENFLKETGHQEVLECPERIFNGDESGFSLCPKTGKVLGPRGFRNLYEVKAGSEKDNLTVLVTFNARGDLCPPLIVFPYIRPPKSVTDSMPDHWSLGRSETGWMKGEVFFEYIVNDFNSWLEENEIQKPVLLLVDGHKAHMSLMLSSMCETLGIILYALPPNTTHMLQPADVSVFAPLKANWKKVVRNFLNQPENINKSVTKNNFCLLFKQIIEQPQMSTNIKNGFRKCGLFPLNPDAIDYTKCVQNTLEAINQQAANRSKTDISNQDLISTRKVLKNIAPILKKKKVNIKFIYKEIKKLRKKEPNISFDTGSEDQTNSTVDLSSSAHTCSNTNLSNTQSRPNVSAPNSTNHLEEHHLEPPAEPCDKDSNETRSLSLPNILEEQHVEPPAEPCDVNLNETRCLSSPNLLDEQHVEPAEPCDMDLNETRHLSPRLVDLDMMADEPFRNIPLDNYRHSALLLPNSECENLNKNQKPATPVTESSLSTLHISGNYLDQSSLVSVEDLLVIPLQTSTPTKSISTSEDIRLSTSNILVPEETRKSLTDDTGLFKIPMDGKKVSQRSIDQTATEAPASSCSTREEQDFSTFEIPYDLEKRSLQTLDDIIIIPITENKIEISSTQIRDDVFIAESSSKQFAVAHNTPFDFGESSTQAKTETSTVTSASFGKHLYIPRPLEKSSKNNQY